MYFKDTAEQQQCIWMCINKEVFKMYSKLLFTNTTCKSAFYSSSLMRTALFPKTRTCNTSTKSFTIFSFKVSGPFKVVSNDHSTDTFGIEWSHIVAHQLQYMLMLLHNQASVYSSYNMNLIGWNVTLLDQRVFGFQVPHHLLVNILATDQVCLHYSYSYLNTQFMPPSASNSNLSLQMSEKHKYAYASFLQQLKVT